VGIASDRLGYRWVLLGPSATDEVHGLEAFEIERERARPHEPAVEAAEGRLARPDRPARNDVTLAFSAFGSGLSPLDESAFLNCRQTHTTRSRRTRIPARWKGKARDSKKLKGAAQEGPRERQTRHPTINRAVSIVQNVANSRPTGCPGGHMNSTFSRSSSRAMICFAASSRSDATRSGSPHRLGRRSCSS
jgi:hypothetical protein